MKKKVKLPFEEVNNLIKWFYSGSFLTVSKLLWIALIIFVVLITGNFFYNISTNKTLEITERIRNFNVSIKWYF